MTSDNLYALKTYELKDDLLVEKRAVERLPEPTELKLWKPLFLPRDFILEHKDLKISKRSLAEV